MRKEVIIPNADGRELRGMLTLPNGDAPHKALLIAPGSNYPKEGAIIATLGVKAMAAGWASLAFDWSYTIYGGSASGGRKREIREMEAALAYLVGLTEIDQTRIVISGKSLGAAVTYALFMAHKELLGAALLTPVFRTPEGAEKGYGGLANVTRPVHLLTGRSDPLNNLDVMAAHIAGSGSNIATTVVGGDHGLNISRKKDDESGAANQANIDDGVGAVVDWLQEL